MPHVWIGMLLFCHRPEFRILDAAACNFVEWKRGLRALHLRLCDNDWTGCGQGRWLCIKEDMSTVRNGEFALFPQQVSSGKSVQQVFNFLRLQRTRAPCSCACVMTTGSDVRKACRCVSRKKCHMCGLRCCYFATPNGSVEPRVSACLAF